VLFFTGAFSDATRRSSSHIRDSLIFVVNGKYTIEVGTHLSATISLSKQHVGAP